MKSPNLLHGLLAAMLAVASNAYARGLLNGIVAYLRGNHPWSIYLAEHGRGDHLSTLLSHEHK
ncbi:MAG: hypothetical protein WCO56_09480 [Verrucomicrobiota bacterium]